MKCVSKLVKALPLLLSLILIPVQAMAANPVWDWGANSYGQLGIGSYDNQ